LIKGAACYSCQQLVGLKTARYSGALFYCKEKISTTFIFAAKMSRDKGKIPKISKSHYNERKKL